VGLISAPGDAGNPTPPGSTPALPQFQADPKGDARIFYKMAFLRTDGSASGRFP
jgi:hypothetical protein